MATNSFVKPAKSPSCCARWLPTLLIMLNMLMGAYAGAALVTAARLRWDAGTKLAARRLLAEQHGRLAVPALAGAGAALLLLADLALLALHCRRCCRLSLLLLYTVLMLAMIAAEVTAARRVLPELEERVEAAHALVRSLAAVTAQAFSVLNHEVIAGVAAIANSIGEVIKTLPTLPSLPESTLPTVPELPELPDVSDSPAISEAPETQESEEIPELRSQKTREPTTPALSSLTTLKLHFLSSSQSSLTTTLSSSTTSSSEMTLPPQPSPPSRVSGQPSLKLPARTTPQRSAAPARRRARSVENIQKFGRKFQNIVLDVDRDLPVNLTVAKIAALCLVVLQVLCVLLAVIAAFQPRRSH